MKCVDVVSNILNSHEDNVAFELWKLSMIRAIIIKVEKIKRNWFILGNTVTRIWYEDVYAEIKYEEIKYEY